MPQIMQTIALYLIRKYRAQAAISGFEQAARNLKKQGYPIELALLILLYEKE